MKYASLALALTALAGVVAASLTAPDTTNAMSGLSSCSGSRCETYQLSQYADLGTPGTVQAEHLTSAQTSDLR